MNTQRIAHLKANILHLQRLLAKEMGITLKQLYINTWGYSSPVMARRSAKRLAERVAANKAGFLTIKAWKHAKEKK